MSGPLLAGLKRRGLSACGAAEGVWGARRRPGMGLPGGCSLNLLFPVTKCSTCSALSRPSAILPMQRKPSVFLHPVIGVEPVPRFRVTVSGTPPPTLVVYLP